MVVFDAALDGDADTGLVGACRLFAQDKQSCALAKVTA